MWTISKMLFDRVTSNDITFTCLYIFVACFCFHFQIAIGTLKYAIKVLSVFIRQIHLCSYITGKGIPFFSGINLRGGWEVTKLVLSLLNVENVDWPLTGVRVFMGEAVAHLILSLRREIERKNKKAEKKCHRLATVREGMSWSQTLMGWLGVSLGQIAKKHTLSSAPMPHPHPSPCAKTGSAKIRYCDGLAQWNLQQLIHQSNENNISL